MIEKQLLKSYASRGETNFRNVLREYVQHLFLASFYKKEGSENFLFKGGTALKLIFGSPRFSEDIDFSGIKDSGSYEKILEDVLLDLSFESLKFDLLESKPTAGGHLAIINIDLFGEIFELHQEISFRQGAFGKKIAIVAPRIVPSYRVYTLDPKIIVKEKVRALIFRQKPRDFFDLYFILRKEELRQALKLEKEEREAIVASLAKKERRELFLELKNLLPKSFWPVVKDLSTALKRELEK